MLPRPRDVGLVAVRPAQLLAGALLPVDVPRDVGPALDALRATQRNIEDALVPIMAGVIRLTGWMQAPA